jgi:hypothetical protein
MSRRTLILLPAALLSLPASGADLLQCVNPDVRKGLLYVVPTDSVLNITDEMPPQIAAIPRPDGLTWVAASIRTSGVVGAFRAEGEPQAAVDAAVAALAPDGWVADDSYSSRSPFASSAIDASATLCREGEPRSVSARRIDSVTYLNYSVSANAERSVCQSRMPTSAPRPSAANLRAGPFAGPPPGATGLDALAPTLEITTLDPTAIPRGSGGSGLAGSIRRSTTLRIASDLETVAGHIEGQLDAQGWARDADWSGSVMAGSTWSREMDSGKLATLAIDVMDLGNSSFEIAMHMAEMR